MTDAELLTRPDIILGRRLPDGRELHILPLFGGAARLCLDPMRAGYSDGVYGGDSDGGHDEVWDYPNLRSAVAAMLAWDGAAGTEPAGWHRHPSSGRRRPDCDPEREYVRE